MPSNLKNKLSINGRVFDSSNPDNDTLIQVNCHLNGNLINDSLGIDSLNTVIRDTSVIPELVIADGIPAFADGLQAAAIMSRVNIDKTVKYGDIVQFYHDSKMIGKFRLESIKRTGKTEYKLNCISDIGILATSYHYGGIYTGQATSIVLREIIGGIISYNLSEQLANVPVYGLLRKNTRRDNLRDLLFAIGGQIEKSSDGTVTINPMLSKTPYDISGDKIYDTGSVSDGTPATEVRVTEHSYIALSTDKEETLYDGQVYAEPIITPLGISTFGILVDFTEPMHDLHVSNAVIIESGVNYAVISGSPHAVLIGKKYSHTERVLSYKNDNTRSTPKVIATNACTLVNLFNSENVVNRVWDYYSSAKTVKGNFVLEDQKIGDNVRFRDVFGDIITGYISEMNLTMSSIVKADATIISNYNPGHSGNYYERVLVVSESQTVVIPQECKGKIRVVLIGGGDGGAIGSKGETGGDGTTSSVGLAGKGGAPGIPGAGGKIFITTITAKAGQAIPVTIGIGGKGQTLTTAATQGEATKFGQYSSDQGLSDENGFVNLLTGDIYGTTGAPGLPGGVGVGKNYPNGENIVYKGITYTPGAFGESDDTACGGAGGGAAAGSNGGDGKKGRMSNISTGEQQANGGDGGRGATPVKAENAQVPGGGGGAGHGGGGGGGGGCAYGGTRTPLPGWGGNGGDPGDAGDGANGIVLLFY